MTEAEARHIALDYLSERNEGVPGFKLSIGDYEEFTNHFYFDLVWLTIDGQIPNMPPVAGGARGMTVSKDNGQVELVAHAEYSILKKTETDLDEIYQLLMEFKNDKNHLADLKIKFNLGSRQLLELSRLLTGTKVERGEIYKPINALINKIEER